jgi:hypothetical protein
MVVIIVKLLTGIITTLLANSIDTYESIEPNGEQTEFYDSRYSSRNPRENAFQIPDNKCNVCHCKRKQRHEFTAKNMDAWANDIYEQVFIKKRML